MTTTTLKVPGIHCEHCVMTIKRVVSEEVDGVTEVIGDHEAKQVTITFEPPATIEQIAETMAEWDYPPELG